MALLDQLIGCLQEGFRDCQAKRFDGLEIDDQLILGGKLNWQAACFCTFENQIDMRCGLPILIDAVRNKAATLCEKAIPVNRRKLKRYPFRKVSRSALIVAASVVGMPCGKSL
jgi:hypothetical protein